MAEWLRRILAFVWAIVRHTYAFWAALLGSFFFAVPGWIVPLLSPPHSQKLTTFLAVSAHTYKCLAFAFLGLGMFYASFLAWNEEHESLVTTHKTLPAADAAA
jgi:hypothetical protein